VQRGEPSAVPMKKSLLMIPLDVRNGFAQAESEVIAGF
jgi:hypothetical protein